MHYPAEADRYATVDRPVGRVKTMRRVGNTLVINAGYKILVGHLGVSGWIVRTPAPAGLVFLSRLGTRKRPS